MLAMLVTISIKKLKRQTKNVVHCIDFVVFQQNFALLLVKIEKCIKNKHDF
jgi:hypothetical protein